ncbi:hypothetical protein FA95DRAFT_222230 [Auriscalpium vulgare]|uniref:Uncharacterized protein n=1 Tax=Auriscalpium vulgare TaxID=40419 RepID=A0ACB8RKV8_9AGAM|nr:hypothetical protein FA95DRAFT_222230 [Auriscalpium vulgare]
MSPSCLNRNRFASLPTYPPIDPHTSTSYNPPCTGTPRPFASTVLAAVQPVRTWTTVERTPAPFNVHDRRRENSLAGKINAAEMLLSSNISSKGTQTTHIVAVCIVHGIGQKHNELVCGRSLSVDGVQGLFLHSVGEYLSGCREFKVMLRNICVISSPSPSPLLISAFLINGLIKCQVS